MSTQPDGPDTSGEKQALWVNMALASGVAAFLLASSAILVLLAVVFNVFGWRVHDPTHSRSKAVLAAASGLTAVAVIGFFTGTTFI